MKRLWPVPPRARERVVERHPSGAKARSRYYRAGKQVAEMLWEENGNPSWGWRLRDGKRHGPSIEWWSNGQVAFFEPHCDNLPHGVARHWDDQGRLLLETRYLRGTGVDLWCDLYNRSLSEETPLEAGTLHGLRRWWNGDGETVWMEEPYREGKLHGVAREWRRGRLRRRYFIDGEAVDRRAYLRASDVPPLDAADDDPHRPLPPTLVGQPIFCELWARRRRKHAWRIRAASLDEAVAGLRDRLNHGYRELSSRVTVEVVRAALRRAARKVPTTLRPRLRELLDGGWPPASRFFACSSLREGGSAFPCFLLRLVIARGQTEFAVAVVDVVWP